MCVHAGLDKIEFLQTHQHEKIYAAASRIIDKYFKVVEEVEESISGLQPQLAPGGQQFMFGSNGTQPQGNLEF